MHVYIYDSFLSGSKNEKILARVETRLTDLGLNGKISRVGLMKNVSSVVKNELMRGAKTIIAVGNDQTVNEVVSSLAHSNVIFGIIPIGNHNEIAKTLGINSYSEACDIISARRIEKIDLGIINQSKCFLTQFSFDVSGVEIRMDDNFDMVINERGVLSFLNMPSKYINHVNMPKVSPADGKLNMIFKKDHRKKYIFQNQTIDDSFFTFKNLEIKSSKHKIISAGDQAVDLPATVSTIKAALNIIVGKDRQF